MDDQAPPTATAKRNNSASPQTPYVWRWKQWVWLETIALAAIGCVLFPAFMVFASGLPDEAHPERTQSFETRLLGGIVVGMLGSFLPLISLLICARYVELNERTFRVVRGIGLARMGDRTEVVGIRPRQLVGVKPASAATDEPVRVARHGKRDLTLPYYGMDIEDVRISLAARLGWAPSETNSLDDLVMNRLKDRVTTDPPDSPPLSWKAKPQSSGLWLPTTLTLLLFAFPVATRLAGLQVFDESAGVVAIILFYLSGCLIAWFTWWPRLCDRRRGGPVERLEIDRAGVRLIRRRGVEEWKHDQIPGVRLFTFKGGRPSTSISVCFADPNRPRRCVRVLEADFVTPPGEIAAEMIRRFGEAVQSPAGVERRT